jgi:hypothetical protein
MSHVIPARNLSSVQETERLAAKAGLHGVKGARMPPKESLDDVEHSVVPNSGDTSQQPEASADDEARPTRRSKVRVLQYSRSDLLI